MRAIVIATGHTPESTTFSARQPNVLLPLVDRPFIQHLVEYLIDQGITEFDFILSQAPEQIEALFGDGTRWGSRFNFHLTKDPGNPYSLLRAISGDGTEPVLLVHGDRLTTIPLGETKNSRTPILFCYQNAEKALKWTGWAWIAPFQLAALAINCSESLMGLSLMLMVRSQGEVIEVEPPLSVERPELLLEAQRRVLEKEFTCLPLHGREVDPGIWLARNVSLHPTARVVAPAFIGGNCRIGPGVQVGPNVTIGSDCILDKRCTLEDTVLLSGTYVGEALELSGAIVDRNHLSSVRMGVSVTVADNFILGSLNDKHAGRFVSQIVSRLSALALLALTWPILLVTALVLKLTRRGAVVSGMTAIQLPTSGAEHEWRHFKLWSFRNDATHRREVGIRDLLLNFLPGIVNVVTGKLHFVGVAPRTEEQIKNLTKDWRSLYLTSKAGLITEAYVHQGANPSDDELFASEAFYSVSSGLRHDLLLVLKYFARVFGEAFVRSSDRPTKVRTTVAG